MASNIPISTGSGAASVATEQIGNFQFQQIKVIGGEVGSTSVLGVNPDRSINVSVIGTISTSGSVTTIPSGNQSVSGTVGASVIGWVPVQPSNTSTISYVQNSIAAVIIGGSIAATITPAANQSVSGTVGASVIGWVPIQPSNTSIITRWADSSVIAFQGGTQITSLVSTVPSSVIVGASIFGQLPAGTAVLGSVATLQGTTPWINTNVGSIITTNVGSVITVGQGSVAVAIVSGSIVATFTPAANQSVSGAVTVAGSVLLGSSNASVIALLQTSSIIGINAGSVVAISQGSVIAVLQSSSLLAVPVGSTIAVLQAASVVGTYAEDAAHTSGDKGLFALGVRNDTMASITSADGDYSPLAVGPVGEMITTNAPITKWIRGTADLRVVQGASVTAIAVQGASIFTYITGVQVVNFGPSSVIVTLGGGLGSILGYTIAPAGGGSNIYYPNALKTGENSAFTASINGTASVLVSAQGFTAKI